MILYDFGTYVAKDNINIVDAMEMIDKNGDGTLLIVNDDENLVGAVSDGDIRRWLIKTGSLDMQVSAIMNKNPRYLTEEFQGDAEQYLRAHSVKILPIVDGNFKIVAIVKESQVNSAEHVCNCDFLKDIPVVIMAGGKGTRLFPYTKILPKPLIPINDIPIVERIITEFVRYGVNSIYMTLNYKKEMIKSYFSDTQYSKKLLYVEEDHPLGTAGALKLLGDIKSSYIIVTNCDVLIRADYEDICRHHMQSKNAMTVVSSLMKTTIPYGVLKTKSEGLIESIDEKPSINYAVNTGMYIINTDLLKFIPQDTFYNMTDFMDKLLNDGQRVGIYPVSEDSFLDMGEFVEMQRMEEKLKDNILS